MLQSISPNIRLNPYHKEKACTVLKAIGIRNPESWEAYEVGRDSGEEYSYISKLFIIRLILQ